MVWIKIGLRKHFGRSRKLWAAMFVQIQNYNLVPVLSAELQLIFKGAKANKMGTVGIMFEYIHVFRSYFH